MQHLAPVVTRQKSRFQRESHGLLTFLNLQFGTGQLQKVSLDLSRLVEKLVQELQAAYSHHPLIFTGPAEPVFLQADPLCLEQILYHLLQNAVKYSPPGSPIQLQIEQRPTEVRLMVADQGYGIPIDEQPHIFRCFYRGRRAWTQPPAGLGLGLYVVKLLVTLQGGTIQVNSTAGAGAVFVVCLPTQSGEEIRS